jgi:alkylation response protein AidB-like acyl-CoA dehydrogenase
MTSATVAYREGPGCDCPPVRAARDGAVWRLTRSRSFVLDGCQTDLILVPAETGSGVALFLVDVAAAPGLSRPIKHKCVDLLILLELARSAARYAASVSSAPATKEDLYTAAALAGAYCSAAFFTVAAENIQIHGGIGFTWEHDAHMYFRRAKASEVMFGTRLERRAFLVCQLGLSTRPGQERLKCFDPG